MRRRATIGIGFLLLAAVTPTACGGGNPSDDGTAATPDPAPPEKITAITEGHGATLPFPSTTASTATTTATTTARPAEGLPAGFPVPANGILTLAGDSTYSQTIEIRGVTRSEVHEWLVTNLRTLGYVVVVDDPVRVAFTGDGADGVAEIAEGAETPEGVLTVRIALGAPAAE